MNRTRWHFLLGFVAGALSGVFLWQSEFQDADAGWLCIPFTAAAFAFIAAYFQEDFWRSWWS